MKTALAAALLLLATGCATSGPQANVSSERSPSTEAASSPAPPVEEPAEPPAEEPAQENPPVPVGTVQTFSNDDEGTEWTVTVTKVRALRKGVGEYSDKPQNGFFVVAEVLYVVKSGPVEINGSFDFHLATPDGTQHEVGEGNAFSSGIEPTLDSQKIPTGRKLRSNVVYDVPVAHGSIDYTPGNEPLASWKF